MKKAKIIAILVAATASLTATGIVAYSSSDVMSDKTIVIEHPTVDTVKPTERMLQQTAAMAAHRSLEDSLDVDDNGRFIYPDYYAGDYIDEDGNLVICLTSEDTIENYQFLKDKHSCVEFKIVEYSYNELNDTIEDYYSSSEYQSEIVSSSIDVINNKAVFEVSEEMYKMKADDISSKLSLEITDSNPQCCTIISGGEELVNKQNGNFWEPNYSCTVAANVVNSVGDEFLLTCGHKMDVGDKMYYNGTCIGSVHETHPPVNTFSSYGDYSLVKLKDNVHVTYTVYGVKNAVDSALDRLTYLHRPQYTIPVGAECFKFSRKFGYADFDIERTDQIAYNVEDQNGNIMGNLYGMVKCEWISGNIQPGDSGSGIYYYCPDSSYELLGVLSCINEDTNEVYFSPLSHLDDDYTIYTVETA